MKSPVTTTILFVDDNTILIDLFRRRIEMEDERIKMIFAMDGEEALDILRHETPDLIVTNVNMPKMDGIEMMKNMNERGYKYPVIVLTNLPKKGFKDLAMELGAIEYCEKKNFTVNKFRKVLKKYIK